MNTSVEKTTLSEDALRNMVSAAVSASVCFGGAASLITHDGVVGISIGFGAFFAITGLCVAVDVATQQIVEAIRHRD